MEARAIGSSHRYRVGSAADARASSCLVDELPILQFFDGGNPGEHRQIIRIGLRAGVIGGGIE
jgi:hypothetical protein